MPATSVAIQSILENANPSNQYDIIVLHSKITPFVENTVKAMCDGSANVSIRFFDISFILEGSDFFVENRKAITQEAYYRLFIPWLLSEEYKKALYMDGDMIVRKDIMRFGKKAGFRDFNFYSGFSLAPFTDDSENLLCIIK